MNIGSTLVFAHFSLVAIQHKERQKSRKRPSRSHIHSSSWLFRVGGRQTKGHGQRVHAHKSLADLPGRGPMLAPTHIMSIFNCYEPINSRRSGYQPQDFAGLWPGVGPVGRASHQHSQLTRPRAFVWAEIGGRRVDRGTNRAWVWLNKPSWGLPRVFSAALVFNEATYRDHIAASRYSEICLASVDWLH